LSYKKMEPHPGFKKSSQKQCWANAEAVSKWWPAVNGGLGWYRIMKCTVCRVELYDWREFEPKEAE